ncbi:MAG: anaerobic ribonucleoside-triphosphate reductase activating protein [Duncaniella sp.]|nr:anaerobic ribonucleoside-triphosphate reductase activating protein [Duncaniella sp.]
MRVIDIIPGTTVDGPGLRTSIYFAGCSHQCPGCHNPQSWDGTAGHEMTVDEIMTVIEDNGFDVTLTGGDPLYQVSEIIPLAEALTEKGYTVWCYTGYTFEDVRNRPDVKKLLSMCEVLVDGPFIESQRDISLLYRGSSNQRLIDLKATTHDRIVLWALPEIEW